MKRIGSALIGFFAIENQVDVARFLHGSVDAAQKAKELLSPHSPSKSLISLS